MRTIFALALIILAAVLFPQSAFAACPGGGVGGICAQGGNTIGCDVTARGSLALAPPTNLTAVYDPTLTVCAAEICIFGEAADGAPFCEEYTSTGMEVDLFITGSGKVDTIALQYDIGAVAYDFKNVSGMTIFTTVVYGLGGDDVIIGSRDTGTDYEEVLYGDADHDTIFGNGGVDLIFGGPGDDILEGGSEDDEIHGGPDSDTIRGQSGIDRLYGDQGADFISGGSEGDFLHGNDAADALSDGNDTLCGDGGVDQVWGGPW